MSHQTGIRANDTLKQHFAKCKEGHIRILKVSIEEEQLSLSSYKDAKSTWEKDFDQLVPPLVEENQPCYIFFRFDTKNSLGYEWLLISWSPDTASVRQKMLYASTKATLKQEFGSSQIKEELHGTIPSEVTFDGYKKYKKAQSSPAPLSMREEELQEIKRTEINTNISIDTKQHTLVGIECPLTEAAEQAIVDMAGGSYDYLQFKIEIEEEKLHLVCAENLTVDKLPSKVPNNAARYHLFRFRHTHEGDYMEKTVFIYSMPGYSCPIKERMLYSCTKNIFTRYIKTMGVDIEKNLEIETGSELTEQFLYEEIHPTKNLHRPKFAKPRGPPNRGPKRMTKPQQGEN